MIFLDRFFVRAAQATAPRASVRAPDQARTPDFTRPRKFAGPATLKQAAGVQLNGRRVLQRPSFGLRLAGHALRRPCDGAMRWNIDDTVFKALQHRLSMIRKKACPARARVPGFFPRDEAKRFAPQILLDQEIRARWATRPELVRARASVRAINRGTTWTYPAFFARGPSR